MTWLSWRRRKATAAPGQGAETLNCGCPRDGRPTLGHLYCQWATCEEHGGTPHRCEDWEGEAR